MIPPLAPKPILLILMGLFLSGCGHLLYTPPEDGLERHQTGLHEVEVRVPAVEGNKQRAKALEASLAKVSGVKDAKVCHYRGMAFVDFDAAKANLMETMERINSLVSQPASDLEARR